ncbi:lysophospholipid acyltransferase family protein [Lapillicoccus jejuensis]|uniref:1-acyl-sn-glycerol-3-phosphate acyltransferase n=1 Tax=Lapillicoccus jejuensis TaxID=402171 RepID=A0A542DY00_9MICO|nr:lysophospholipid acyltransferase family protein [Lapillicoccus jejuensis]TQJ07971.1 1-acyl-sn-glycerol-3-phosphate acyltransferase [Lapillicoccus jejuensis]
MYRAGHLLLRPLTQLLWRPTVVGAEHVPMSGGVILASNHFSFIDSFVIPLTAPRKVRFLAKDAYWQGRGPLALARRGFMDAMGAIPVDRQSSRAAQDSLDAALEVLRAGDAFGIYPEGTRSRDGRLYRGRTGVAWLALTAGVPVVPVSLSGTAQVMPIGATRPRVAPVTVRFGPPIDVARRWAGVPQGRARREVTDEVMDAIAALSGQERAAAYNDLPADAHGPAIGT